MSVTLMRFCLALSVVCALGGQAHAAGARDAGTFAADLPSASGCGRRVLLELFADDTYVFVQRYLCRPWTSAQMETGSWLGDGREIVLTSTGVGTRFTIEDTGLRYQGDRYGDAGLELEALD